MSSIIHYPFYHNARMDMHHSIVYNDVSVFVKNVFSELLFRCSFLTFVEMMSCKMAAP